MTDLNHIDIRKLDFGLLLVLTEAVRQKKLSTVAETLGLTQSAVSHAVQRLRTLFNDDLLIRRPHGVEPTAKALELATQADRLLSAANSMLTPDQPFDPSASDRSIRVVAWDQELMALGPAVEHHLSSIRISSRMLDRSGTIDALRRGTADLAVGIFNRTPNILRRKVLWQDSFVTIAARAHPRLSGSKALTLDAFCEEGHVLTTLTGSSRGRVDESLAAVRRTRNVRVAAAQFLTTLEVVASTELISTIPSHVANRFANRLNLSVFETPLDMPALIYEGLWHARADSDQTVQWFINLLTK